MPTRGRTIRVSDRIWDGFAAEAKADGISTNQWVVEAALSRLVHARVRKDHPIAVTMDHIYAALHHLRTGDDE